MNRDIMTEIPDWLFYLLLNKGTIFECQEYILA